MAKKQENNSTKNVSELLKEVSNVRSELAKAQLDATMNASKDTNTVGKLRKKLAVLLTQVRMMEVTK